jgi:hypothetical protein
MSLTAGDEPLPVVPEIGPVVDDARVQTHVDEPPVLPLAAPDARRCEAGAAIPLGGSAAVMPASAR